MRLWSGEEEPPYGTLGLLAAAVILTIVLIRGLLNENPLAGTWYLTDSPPGPIARRIAPTSIWFTHFHRGDRNEFYLSSFNVPALPTSARCTLLDSEDRDDEDGVPMTAVRFRYGDSSDLGARQLEARFYTAKRHERTRQLWLRFVGQKEWLVFEREPPPRDGG